MSLRVYNTLTREKEPFQPVHPGKVGIYLCGPTVYKPPHMGHLVGPVIFDAIKRYLVHRGFKVTWVVNITDVDDKIIDEAARRGITFEALAAEQTKLYLDVLGNLGIADNIDQLPRASEHMGEIIAIVQKLIDKRHAYSTGHGDVWFDTATDADYGKLSNRRLEDQEAGLRQLEGSGKKSPADFALWKSVKPNEPAWDSPWGKGRPGWHIECSAMSMKYLGETFDIHGGGDDLKFPHHENELAQSECCTGKTFVKYWLHNGLTRIKTKAASGEWKAEKMSKSLGNTLDARELINTHGPDVIRYLLLSTHYRSPIEFSEEVLLRARMNVDAFTRVIERAKRADLKKVLPPKKRIGVEWVDEQLRKITNTQIFFTAISAANSFVTEMDDDFNTAGAIASLHSLARTINALFDSHEMALRSDPELKRSMSLIVGVWRALAALLGLGLEKRKPRFSHGDALNLLELLMQTRRAAKARKDFATADAIRDGLAALKITLLDRADGTAWEKT